MKKYILIASVFTASLVFALSGSAGNISFTAVRPAPAQKVALSDEQQAILAVRKAKASVVNIVGIQKEYSGSGNLQALVGVEVSSGTGMVWTTDGYIVTNSHVIENSNAEYNVIFVDGSSFPAKVVGLDKYGDVGLLKIEKQNITPIELGDSEVLETGQTVFAIGNSLGKYQNTVSRGVVSGLGRAVDVGGSSQPRLQDLVQTDAAINLGNSGGPLIDLSGRAVGMNTLVETDATNVGFAVSVNYIKRAADQLKNFGKVSRPFMGIQYNTITLENRLLSGIKQTEGAYIAQVTKNSPADKAGLKPGDVVVEINHAKLDQKNELDVAVSKYRAGDQILLKVERGTEVLEMILILGEYH